MKRIFTILSIWSFPLLALAANEVIVDNDTTLQLPDDGSSYTLKATSQFDSLDISSTQFTFTLSQGGRATLVSADRKGYTHNGTSHIKVSNTCDSSQSSVTIDIDPPFTTTAVTLTPSGTCGGGGGGVSGGGGSSSSSGGTSSSSVSPAPVSPTTTITTTTTKPSSTGVLSSAPALFVSSVSLGSRGDEVKRLQEFLARDKEVYPEGIANGNFGPLTKKALTAFQLKYGIIKKSTDPGSGVLGPKTRARINELVASGVVPTPEPKSSVAPLAMTPGVSSFVAFVTVFSQGARGDEVKRLQEFLARDKAIYPEGIANGNFGPLTKKALTAFQLKYGVIKDGSSLGSGRFGPATQAKVNELLGNVPEEKVQVALPTSKTEAGDSAKVKTLQDQLKALQDSLNLLKGTQ